MKAIIRYDEVGANIDLYNDNGENVGTRIKTSRFKARSLLGEMDIPFIEEKTDADNTNHAN